MTSREIVMRSSTGCAWRIREAAAHELVFRLGSLGGGRMAGHYGSNEALGLDPRWQGIASQAFVGIGSRFSPIPEA